MPHPFDFLQTRTLIRCLLIMTMVSSLGSDPIGGRGGRAFGQQAVAVAAAEAADLAPRGANWPGFRGHGDGHTGFSEVPVHWSDQDNLVWRKELPGYGQSAPIIWGSQVFVTSVQGPNKETLILSSLDWETGEVRWRRRFEASQQIESSDMVSQAAPTPVVDADSLFAFWGSGDLIAVSHDGETRWQRSLTRDYGDFLGAHGVGSSPVLVDDLVVVQVTHEGPSYYLAIDKRTGENRWKADRPEGVAWTTPIIVGGTNEIQIVTSAAGRIEALDAKTGDQKWSFHGIERNNVPSVVVDEQLLVAPSTLVGQSLALPRALAGEVADSQISWRAEAFTSGFSSPLIHQDCVLLVNKTGVLVCLDRESGKATWKHRLAGACWASPIAAGELVFFFTKRGQTTVLRHGPDGPEVVAENQLDLPGIVYGVAAVRDSFVIRSGTEIARVGKTRSSSELARDRPRSP